MTGTMQSMMSKANIGIIDPLDVVDIRCQMLLAFGYCKDDLHRIKDLINIISKYVGLIMNPSLHIKPSSIRTQMIESKWEFGSILHKNVSSSNINQHGKASKKFKFATMRRYNINISRYVQINDDLCILFVRTENSSNISRMLPMNWNGIQSRSTGEPTTFEYFVSLLIAAQNKKKIQVNLNVPHHIRLQLQDELEFEKTNKMIKGKNNYNYKNDKKKKKKKKKKTKRKETIDTQHFFNFSKTNEFLYQCSIDIDEMVYKLQSIWIPTRNDSIQDISNISILFAKTIDQIDLSNTVYKETFINIKNIEKELKVLMFVNGFPINQKTLLCDIDWVCGVFYELFDQRTKQTRQQTTFIICLPIDQQRLDNVSSNVHFLVWNAYYKVDRR